MKDDLGDRMKKYESVFQNSLVNNVPAIIRIDGKCFSSFCKRFRKPYDDFFNDCMNQVMEKLCLEIQGAKLGEHHSDEISILVTDYDTIRTEAYFGYKVQKLVSVVAGMASSEFCRQIYYDGILSQCAEWPSFDCRCFNLPEAEVSNYFIWRQNDAIRNSIAMLAQSKFSHKELHGKNKNEMQEMLFQKFGINWDSIVQEQKTGFFCVKHMIEKEIDCGPNKGEICERSVWGIEPSPRSLTDLRKIVSDVLPQL